MIKDSGNRRQFETGAVRDIQEGKGRCDLLPIDIIGRYANIPCLEILDGFIHGKDRSAIWNAFVVFAVEAFGDIHTALLETSIHYEEGAKKYDERNWEKGITVYCYIDSAIRHCLKYYRGDKDERHDRAFCWNLLGALWTIKNKPELYIMEAPIEKGTDAKPYFI